MVTKEQVKKCLDKFANDYLSTREETECFDYAIKALDERKTGRWVLITKMDGRTLYECSVCDKRVIFDDLMDLPNYCDHCGAKMEGVEECD